MIPLMLPSSTTVAVLRTPKLLAARLAPTSLMMMIRTTDHIGARMDLAKHGGPQHISIPTSLFCSHIVEGLSRYLNMLHICVHSTSTELQRPKKLSSCASFDIQRISFPFVHAHTPILILQWCFSINFEFPSQQNWLFCCLFHSDPSSGSGCEETRLAEDMHQSHVISRALI